MSEAGKTPLIRLVKRVKGDMISPRKIWAIRIGSIIFAFILGMIPILMAGSNPFQSYGIIISGALSKPGYIRQTVKRAVPLLGAALAIAPCFKMRFWNIGAEGQITMGAIFASAIAIWFQDSLPALPLLTLMMLAGIAGGAIWAFIPGFFKAKYNTNETLFTLMMNYIAIGIVRWLQGGPWEGRPGTQIIPMFKDNARLPNVFGIYCGWIIVLILVVVVHIYMNFTKHGYEVAVIGDSINTARYAGMNVGWVMMRTMLFSGAICGCVGWMLVSGANGTLNADVAGGVGFTAITVAWLSQLNSFAMIIIAGILAIIGKGSTTLQTKLNVPASVADIVSGILLFCMLGCEFFINYRMVFRGKKEGKV
ncbi:MAG: ABC transporter permease [Spirochaetales bacterium]|nr:ABC transporter permease [Spirochaetales bacterium]MBP5756663.1 ABC transporter permease [Spirochaetales bacterium]